MSKRHVNASRLSSNSVVGDPQLNEKGSPGKDGNKRCLYVQWPAKFADEAEESAAVALYAMLQTMCDAVLKEPNDIPIVYGAWRDNQSKKAKRVVCAGDNEKFTEFGTLKSLDETWATQWIVDHSDITKAQVKRAMDIEPDTVSTTLSLALQIGQCMTLDPRMRVREVCRRVFEDRDNACGNRLQDFAARGGISDDGTFDLDNCGAYEFLWNSMTHALYSIKHLATGDFAVLGEDDVMDKSFKVRAGYSDRLAALKKGKLAPTHVIDFFEDGTGPYKLRHTTPQSKHWQEQVQKSFDDWQNAVENAHTGGQEDDADLRAAIAERDLKKRQAANEELAEKARKRMRESRAAQEKVIK